MFPNQLLKARAAASLAAVFIALAGCSMLSTRDADYGARDPVSAPGTSEAGAPIPPPTGNDSTAPPDMTATQAAIEAGGAQTMSSSESVPAPAPVLNPSAPKSYTVKRGDTLWGISSMFLRDPWLWPEIWYVNPRIENPHLIYPGDVLALAYGADGRPQVQVVQGGPARLEPRLRSSPLDGAIPTIPYSAIAAFLSRPAVLSIDQVRHSPHVLTFREEHQAGGTGHEFYVSDLNAAPNARFTVMHVGEAVRDPDNGEMVGYQGIYTATAVITRPGNPAKGLLTDSARETLRGDLVLAAMGETPPSLTLRAPHHEVRGRIMSVIDGVRLIGQYDVVLINRGTRDGIDAGDILAIDNVGGTVRDSGVGYDTGFGFGAGHDVRLPNERAGTLLLFKSYEHMSYGLVVGESNPVRVADVVRNP
jgi:LysM repeat protein